MKVSHTSQLSRMAQSPSATDLSGGKTSEVLSTVRRNNLAAEDAVCFRSGLSLDAAASIWTRSGISGSPVSPVRNGYWNRAVHVLSDSPPCELEGVSAATFPTYDWGGG